MTKKTKQKKEADKSTILLDKGVINLVKDAKEYPKQTYDEIIRKMSELFISAKKEIEENLMKKEEKDKERIIKSISNSMYKENF